MIQSVTSSGSYAAPLARTTDRQTEQFLEFIKKQSSRQTQDRDKAREAAAGLVAHALILPMLKQIRRSTFNMEGPFSPGIAEKTFGPEFDMQLAERIAQSPRLGVTETLANRLIRRGKAAVATHEELDVHG